MSDIVERWTLGGYAPGEYFFKCATCEKQSIGDKRAIQCLPCAGKHAADEIERLRAALREIAGHPRGGMIDTSEKFDRDEFIEIARAALEGK